MQDKNNKTFHFNILSFIVAFSIGIIYVFVNVPKPEYIIKYPTPYNAEKIVYRGQDDNMCFKFKAEEIKCTKNFIKQPVI